MALTKIDDRGVTYPLDLLDNEKIRFGTGNDLEIYNDGSNNVISGTVNNWIKSTGTQGFTAGSDYQLKCIADGAVELYYDNSKKLETTNGGGTLTGDWFMNTGGYLSFPTNVQALFGTGTHLRIYSDGTNNEIRSNGGRNIYIRPKDTEVGIKVVPDGAVELYYDNSKKFETTSEGSKAYGIFRVEGAEGADGKLLIQADDGDDNDDYTRLRHGADGYFYIENYSSGSYETAIKSNGDGAVELYYDNSKKLETRSAGVNTLGNHYVFDNNKFCCGDAADLEIYHTSSNNHSNIRHTQAAGNLYIDSAGSTNFRHYVDTGGTISFETYATFNDDGAVELYHDNIKTCQTTTNGVIVYGAEANDANLWLYADEGDDNADKWKFNAAAAGGFFLENAASGSWETSIKCNGNGAVELYYDGTRACYTASNALKFDDNKKAIFGGNLELFHDGTHNNIRSNSGELHIKDTDGDYWIRNEVNGSVSLFYNGTEKLKTEDYGIRIRGERPVIKLECTAGASNTDPRALINFTSTNANNDADMYRINFWEGNATNEINSDAHMSLRYHGDGEHGGSGSISFRNESGAATLYMNRSGNGGTSGSWTVGSDSRKKENIVTVADALTKVSQLRGVDFKWKEKYGGHQCAGVIAQEIETVLPHLVDEFSAEKLEDGSTMKSVNYNGLWGVMIEALKEAKTKIETLETEVAALKAK